MFAGNQGYQVDGELVKAGLILPLDKYAKAYGWDDVLHAARRCSSSSGPTDGATFGEGTLYGVAQSGQSTGVFANMAKLKDGGRRPGVAEDVRRLRRGAGEAAQRRCRPTSR